MRAIAPLCVALLLLVLVVLRLPLPVSHFDVQADSQEEQSSEDSKCSQQQLQQQQTAQGPGVPYNQVRASSELCCEEIQDTEQLALEGPTHSTDALSTILLPDSQHHAATSKQAAPATAKELRPVCLEAGGLKGVAKSNLLQAPDAAEHVVDTAGIEAVEQHVPAAANSSNSSRAQQKSGWWGWVRQHSALLWGMLMCQVGMILFNLGLTYGFTALGDMTGTWLPTSFIQLPYAPGSPYYSVAGKHRALMRMDQRQRSRTHLMGRENVLNFAQQPAPTQHSVAEPLTVPVNQQTRFMPQCNADMFVLRCAVLC